MRKPQMFAIHDQSSAGAVSLATDPLSELLHDLRPRGAVYGQCVLGAPWAIAMPTESCARLHVVLHGRARFALGASAESNNRATTKREWLELSEGDVIFLARGDAHLMANGTPIAFAALDSLPISRDGEQSYSLRTGGGGEETVMVCCSIDFDAPVSQAILQIMPPLFLVSPTVSDDMLLRSLITAMAAEVKERRVGGAGLLMRLVDATVTLIVRRWAEVDTASVAGWLAGVRDPHVGKALVAIHRDPGNRWTAASLAMHVGLSRTVFYERFTAKVGFPPAEYLTRWRVRLAREALTAEPITVSQLANKLGYDTEAGFSRAFRRVTGVSPGRFAVSGAPASRV
jgi:AraC-like DNA-binding protein